MQRCWSIGIVLCLHSLVWYVQAEERFEEHPLFAAVAAAKQGIEDAEEHQ